MSRLLSQDEVDALLASLDTEESLERARHETAYDLRAPLILAGERLALVLAACEKLAPRIADAVTLLLTSDTPVRGQFTGLVQQPAGTVLATLTPSEPLALIAAEDGATLGGISLQSELGLTIVDRAQGGSGSARTGARRLSSVETRLLEESLGRLIRHLGRHTALAPVRSGGLDEDPIFGRLAVRGGALATALFRLSTPFGDAVCRLMMTPQLANRLLAIPAPRERGQTPERLKQALRAVGVTLEPVISGATLRVTDLRRLGPGHVIQLDIREHASLALRCNGQILARGRLKRAGVDRVFEIEEFVPRLRPVPGEAATDRTRAEPAGLHEEAK